MAQIPAVGPPAGAAAVTAPPLRGVYLPGSWPGEGGDVDPDGVTAEAMARLMRAPLSLAAHDLACLADGEPRRGYVIYLVQSLCREPNVRVARAGDWSSFGDRTVLAKRHLWSRLPDLDRHLRYAAFAERSLPVLRRVRGEYGRSDLPLLAGIPSPLTAAAVVFGMAGLVLYRRPFRLATAREMARIQALGTDVMFQLEAPAETVALASAPAWFRPLLARVLGADICRLARMAPEGARLTVHLCLGSLNDEPAIRLRSCKPLVLLANAIARMWPGDRELVLLHLPLTTTADPARLDTGFYAPLARLRLPDGAQIAAGIVHAAQPYADQRQALRLVRAALPQQARLCVAPPCGLGRSTPHGAELAVQRAVVLAHSLSN